MAVKPKSSTPPFTQSVVNYIQTIPLLNYQLSAPLRHILLLNFFLLILSRFFSVKFTMISVPPPPPQHTQHIIAIVKLFGEVKTHRLSCYVISIPVTYPTHHTLLNFTILLTPGEQYKSYCSLLCVTLNCSVNSPFFY